MAANPLVYPKIAPVASESDSGWNQDWSRGAEFTTEYMDYIVFTPYKIKYNVDGTGAFLTSVNNVGSATPKDIIDTGQSIYLYMPQSISATYSAQYNQAKIGVAGVAAAQALGQKTGEDIAATLKAAAGSASPEAAFTAFSEGLRGVTGTFGIAGDLSGPDLLALNQGKVFNPFEEQIFQGISFRNHNFQFKLVARNIAEAETISNIIKSFKKNMLPTYENDVTKGAVKPKEAPKDNTQQAQNAQNSAQTPGQVLSAEPFGSTIGNRYLSVPSRFKVEFVRILKNGSDQGNINLFKLKDCIIDNLNVVYTPDGQYVSTEKGYVPAIELAISLKEVAIVTAKDIDEGF